MVAVRLVVAPTTQSLENTPSSFTPTQVQSYSLSVEHQFLSSIIATVAQAGSQTRHIMTFQGGYDFNFPFTVFRRVPTSCKSSYERGCQEKNSPLLLCERKLFALHPAHCRRSLRGCAPDAYFLSATRPVAGYI